MSAMRKGSNVVLKRTKTKVKRKGVHAKTKTSASLSSKNYKKSYNGQGRG